MLALAIQLAGSFRKAALPYPPKDSELVSVGGGRLAVLHLEPWTRAAQLVNQNEKEVVKILKRRSSLVSK